jgi:integrase
MLKIGTVTEKERVYYIRYRQGAGRLGKMVEERAGRASEGMTPARANQLRAMRMTGREQSNTERREVAAVKRRAEEELANRPTIGRLWSLYNDAKPDRATRRDDGYMFRNHLEKFAVMLPDNLTTSDIDRLRLSKSKKYSPQTVKHIIALLRRIINHAVRKGHCLRPNIIFDMPILDNAKTETMTPAQMGAYLAALDDEEDKAAAAALRLALCTGMRKTAILSLEWRDIDFERGFITLRGEAAKSGKSEKIPMSLAARAVLEKLEHSSSKFLFPGKNGGRRTTLQTIARRVRDRAGLPPDFRPVHSLRHVFASGLASSGQVDLYTLQRLLTHNSPEMTARYAHLADEALQRAANVAGDVFRAVAGEKAKVHQFLPDGTCDE